MTEEAILGESFYRELIRVAAEEFASYAIPGSHTAAFLLERAVSVCANAAWGYLKKFKIPEKKQLLDALAKLPIESANSIAKSEVNKHNLSSDVKRELVNYLSAIPMTTRQAISHPNDGGKPNTLLSQIPLNSSGLTRFMPIRPPRFQPGDNIPAHDYQVETLLGQGGFAEVWKARNVIQDYQPEVALKFCLDPTLLASLKVEIKVYEKLKEFSEPELLVRLIGTAYRADPPFLVYEYVDGGDLTSWLASFDGERPTVVSVLRILKMAVRPLAFAHKNGIIHCDLKPANLLVTREGRVKLADFGIGTILANANTANNNLKGVEGATILQGAYTPIYSDGSQRLGKQATPLVDIYALGVIAYQLLIGDVSRPIGPAWRDELLDIDVPKNVLDLIASCVGIPARRFPNGEALQNDLDAIYHELPNKVVINFCNKCGYKVQPEDRFCIKCSYKIR